MPVASSSLINNSFEDSSLFNIIANIVKKWLSLKMLENKFDLIYISPDGIEKGLITLIIELEMTETLLILLGSSLTRMFIIVRKTHHYDES